ncbi:unnamed protein product [Ectocarpus sp. 6 AP-2014]
MQRYASGSHNVIPPGEDFGQRRTRHGGAPAKAGGYIRRLLLRVEAVHAVSWLWPSDASFLGHAAENGPEPLLPPLRLMLPILKRRTKGRGGLAATLLRHSAKV